MARGLIHSTSDESNRMASENRVRGAHICRRHAQLIKVSQVARALGEREDFLTRRKCDCYSPTVLPASWFESSYSQRPYVGFMCGGFNTKEDV
jgi:hypothetical protein